jgi:hypothetical protein
LSGAGARASLAALLVGLVIPVVAEGGVIALSFGDAPGGAARGFRIERRASGGARFVPVALVGPGVAQYVDRGIPDGTRYCYRVRSLGDDTAAWSPEVCAEALSADDPAPPPSEPAPPGEDAQAPAPAPADPPAGETAPTEDPPSGSPGAPRRIRTSGGWLQVLD